MTTITQDGSTATLLLPGTEPFKAKLWLNYFEQNKSPRSSIVFPEPIIMAEAIKKPLLRSLQRFQIGETGEGSHLKKFARGAGCADYLRCIDLFIKEEQAHGQILAEVITSLNGSLLSWHWTELAFIILRRLFGLKTELFIILIAEVVGKCFYRCVADKVNDERLSNAFAIIVCDEIAHLRFHSEFLCQQMLNYPWF